MWHASLNSDLVMVNHFSKPPAVQGCAILMYCTHLTGGDVLYLGSWNCPIIGRNGQVLNTIASRLILVDLGG
jgi:hypothetical protein